MTKLTINELREEHTAYYEQALENIASGNANTQALNKFRVQVDAFLSDVVSLSKECVIIGDYRWLSETLYKWTSVYKVLFKQAKHFELYVPENKMILPAAPSGRILADAEIAERVEGHAKKKAFYRIREVGWESNEREQLEDYHHGEVMIAKEVLEGSIKFAESVSSKSFPRLQNIWLNEVKEIMAYFIWDIHGHRVTPSTHEDDYQDACDNIRSMLVDPNRKAKLSLFLEVKAFIENRYLNKGRLDENKPDAVASIERKASRIESRLRPTGQRTHDFDNWLDAKAYMKLFYENIIPAVIEKNKECVLAVLKAFQFTKTVRDKMHVVDAFEVAVAISYLDEDLVNEIWELHKEDHAPYSAISSYVESVEEPSWLSTLKEAGLDVYYADKKIWLRGMIFEKQYDTLAKEIKSDHDQLLLISLFLESRMIKRMATL